ncbi:MAG: DoxX-like family protein [Leptospiraceae bacterium]|nr:DoxX-like family protein [Leptospiraceae bacterium]
MKNPGKLKFSLILLSIFYILAGAMHFIIPDFYVLMLPAIIPFPKEVIYLTGLVEITLGFSVLNYKIMRPAAWSIIIFLIAVFPANFHVYWNDVDLGVPRWVLLIRLPLQIVLIFWAYMFARKNSHPYRVLPDE